MNLSVMSMIMVLFFPLGNPMFSMTVFQSPFLSGTCKYGKIEINGLGRSYGVEKLTLYKMKKNLGKPSMKKWIYKKDQSWKIEANEFYKDIKFNREPKPGLKEALKNLSIIKQIYNLNY